MTTLTFTRTMSTNLVRAWDAWTTPEGLAAWWWPQLPDTTYLVDARVGGSYAIESRVAEIAVAGDYTAVEPRTRLEFTWVWGGRDVAHPDTVTVVLTEVSDGVRVEVEHQVRNAESGVEGYQQGWSDVLDRLAALASGASSELP